MNGFFIYRTGGRSGGPLGCFSLLLIWGVVITLISGGARLSGLSFGVQLFAFVVAWFVWSGLNSHLGRASGRGPSPAANPFPFSASMSPMERALAAGQQQLALFFASARLGIHVARADGQIGPQEIGAIGAYFGSLGWSRQSLLVLMEDLQHFLNYGDDEHALTEAAQVVRRTASTQSELEAVAFMVSMVACADGILHRTERHALEQIRLLLGLSAAQMESALRSAQGAYRSSGQPAPRTVPRTDEHLATLGLAPGATQTDIRKAYLELARKYHPDKVEHMGEDFRKAAEERFKSIQTAYESLRRTE